MKPSDSKEAVRERVRYHRMMERLRPREPFSAEEYHPLELANEALLLMIEARKGLRNTNLIEKQNLAMERLRQLAWGPESD